MMLLSPATADAEVLRPLSVTWDGPNPACFFSATVKPTDTRCWLAVAGAAPVESHVTVGWSSAVAFAVAASAEGGQWLTLSSDKGNACASAPCSPQITLTVNAASLTAGPIAAGEIVTILGLNLGPRSPAQFSLDRDGKVARNLAGLRVLFDGVPAPLLYASETQVNAVVSYEVADRASAPIAVEFNGLRFTSGAPVAGAAPAFFTVEGAGRGQASATNVDGSANGPASPAARGSAVRLLATGVGQTRPRGTAGEMSQGQPAEPTLPVSVKIGGVAATVRHVGPVPGQVAGLFQLTVVVPPEVTPGRSVPVVLTMGSSSSPDGVTIAVQQASGCTGGPGSCLRLWRVAWAPTRLPCPRAPPSGGGLSDRSGRRAVKKVVLEAARSFPAVVLAGPLRTGLAPPGQDELKHVPPDKLKHVPLANLHDLRSGGADAQVLRGRLKPGDAFHRSFNGLRRGWRWQAACFSQEPKGTSRMAASDLVQLVHKNGQPAKRNNRPWYRSPKALRQAVMGFFFLFLAHIAIEHQIKGGGPRGTPSVEAYCPFGGLETLYQFLTTGGFVHRIEPSAVVLFLALVLLTLLASRGFCGWMCPFGSVQEWVGMLGKKIFRTKFNPSGGVDRALRYLKYLVLAVIIALTWQTGSLVFRDYDPFLAFFHFGNGIEELPWAYALLGVVLLGSLWIDRFFCKYACPLGAVLGILGKFGLTKIQRDTTDCKECNLCQQKCHAHVEFLSGAVIRSAECNQCMDCTVDCPKPAVLTMRGWRWRFSHPVFAAVLVAGLAGLVFVSKAAGKWHTKPELASFTNLAGKLDAGQIRGWMTLNDISTGYKVPLNELYAGLGLPARVSANTRINRIKAEHKVEFEPERVRNLVGNVVAGKPAIAFVAQQKVAEKPKPQATHKPRNPHAPGKDAKKAGPQEGGKGEEPEVKGFMTLNEVVLKTGVPKAYILKELGLNEAGIDGRKPLRDWVHEKGRSVPELREIVEKYRKQKK